MRGQGETGVCVWVRPLPYHPALPSPSLPHPTPPACNVTIHNRCKDTLANCTKVKQKVRRPGGQRAGGEGSEGSECLFLHSLPCVPPPLSLPWGGPHREPQASGPVRPASCSGHGPQVLGSAALCP